MTSVIPVSIPLQPLARAPRNVRAKNLQLPGVKSKETLTAGASLAFPTIIEAASFLDNFLEIVQSNAPDKDLKSAVLTLCANLKAHGSSLEIHYKDQLDRVFVHLRNAGRDENLDKISRLHLLEVIELRAARWLSQEQVCSYYQAKLAELEATAGPDVAGNTTQPAPVFSQSESSPPSSPLPLLQPVNPGAKERLVQITGPGSDNIERARQLIEQTIQRNASPVRQVEPSASGASGSQETAQRRESLLLEAALDDYQYSVAVGEHSLKISGSNLELVQAAKLVLDEYFANTASNNRQRTLSSCSSTDDGVVMSCPSQESPRDQPAASYRKMLKYNRESLLMLSNSPLCKGPPANFDLILQNAPEIARKNDQQDVPSAESQPEPTEGPNVPSDDRQDA